MNISNFTSLLIEVYSSEISVNTEPAYQILKIQTMFIILHKAYTSFTFNNPRQRNAVKINYLCLMQGIQ